MSNKGKKLIDGRYVSKWEIAYKKALICFAIACLLGFTYLLLVPVLREYFPPKLVSPRASGAVVYAYTYPKHVEVYEPSIDGMIEFYASKYKVDADEMRCTIKNESGFRKQAKNGTSTASGLGQYIIGTWKSWRTKMGENADPDLRFDAEESIKTMAWAFSRGYQPHWVAWEKYCK